MIVLNEFSKLNGLLLGCVGLLLLVYLVVVLNVVFVGLDDSHVSCGKKHLPYELLTLFLAHFLLLFIICTFLLVF